MNIKYLGFLFLIVVVLAIAADSVTTKYVGDEILHGRVKSVNENEFRADSTLRRRHFYEYDEEGNLSDYTSIKAEEMLTPKEENKNVHKADTTETVMYDEEGDVFLKIYEYREYDDRGNWIRRERYSDSNLYDILIRFIEYYE